MLWFLGEKGPRIGLCALHSRDAHSGAGEHRDRRPAVRLTPREQRSVYTHTHVRRIQQYNELIEQFLAEIFLLTRGTAASRLAYQTPTGEKGATAGQGKEDVANAWQEQRRKRASVRKCERVMTPNRCASHFNSS